MVTNKRLDQLEQVTKLEEKKQPQTWRELIESQTNPPGWGEFIGE